jgi:hypothetical protein
MATDFLRPDLDSADGNWTNQAGNNTDLFDSINETSASDSDYIRSGPNPANDICKLRLSDPTGAAPTEPVDILYRYKKTGAGAINLKVELIKGASTVIASVTHSNISSSFADGALTLNTSQFTACGDFTDLYLQFTANPTAEPILDDYTVGAAFSVRLLRTAYSGNCLKIQAHGGANDGNTLDVGFVDGALDTASITSFVGAGAAHVHTWYDQSGNSLDVSQTTAANQPPLQLTSSINSLPAIEFDASDNFLNRTSVSVTTLAASGQEINVFVVLYQTDPTSGNLTPFAWSGSGETGENRILAHFGNAADTIIWDYGDVGSGGRKTGSEPGGYDSNSHIAEFIQQVDNTQSILIDGASIASGSNTSAPSGTGTFAIGGYATGLLLFDGLLSEVIILSVDIGSTERAVVRADIGNYYGITV